MRLSRKAWNNVIIISMVLMIFLFNSTNNILTGGDDGELQASMLPSGSRLMTLQMPLVTMERIGQGWRARPSEKITEAQMLAVAKNWEVAKMTPSNSDLPEQMPKIAIAWLAGENSGRVFQLYEDGDHTLVLYQQQLFEIRDMPIETLLLENY